MIRTLRLIRRMVLLAVFTLILHSTYMLIRLLLIPFHDVRDRWQNFIVRNWARVFAMIIGMRITVKGTPPDPPFFLVSNHLSYIDIILLFTQVDGMFVAKAEVSGWPIMGFLASSVNTLYIDRKNMRDIPRVNRLIASHLTSRRGIILFPEGTSTCGNCVHKFNPSLLNYPACENLPVSVATVRYETPESEIPAHMAVCWYGDYGFAEHVLELFKVKSIRGTVEFIEEKVKCDDRKLLAAKLQDLAQEQFVPMVKVNEIGLG